MIEKKELQNCNFVKMVLMLIVVLYHSMLFWSGNWYTGNPVLEAKELGVCALWMNNFHIYMHLL